MRCSSDCDKTLQTHFLYLREGYRHSNKSCCQEEYFLNIADRLAWRLLVHGANQFTG